MQTENRTNVLSLVWDKLTDEQQVAFRRKVCAKCGWTSDFVFYRKRTGRTALKPLEIEAIKKLA
jgi:hypothetical protein